MIAALTSRLAGRVSWSVPGGGFFLWARLAPPITSEALLPLAQARGVLFVAGYAFYVDGGGTEFMRLSFATPTIEEIEIGVSRLADAILLGPP
jgi:DNA-binding transcriptional MocR family regulator